MILVAVAIPIFGNSLERAKLAVDMDHYRVMQTYASVVEISGELTVGDVTIRPNNKEQQAFCFLNDGTLSGDVCAGTFPCTVPENAYLAKASGTDAPYHEKGAALALILYKNDIKPTVTWVPTE